MNTFTQTHTNLHAPAQTHTGIHCWEYLITKVIYYNNSLHFTAIRFYKALPFEFVICLAPYMFINLCL